MPYKPYNPRPSREAVASTVASTVASAVLAAAMIFVLAGCFHVSEEVSIPSAPADQDGAGADLGPNVRILSSGPGEKGSPAWASSGNRLAFTIDGYVVEKSVAQRDTRRRTTKDFGARSVAWAGPGESLLILGEDAPGSPGPVAQEADTPRTLYVTSPEKGDLGITEIASGVGAIATRPEDNRPVVALQTVQTTVQTGASESKLALVEDGGELVELHPRGVPGQVSGFSFSPDGRQAVLAVREPGGRETGSRETGSSDAGYALYAFSLSDPDGFRRLAALEGLEVLGAPQWTADGIYYVAGREDGAGDGAGDGVGDAAFYDLYRIPPGSQTPELAPGVGEDFIASNILRDPEGGRLAIVGRRNPGSPSNLYTLEFATHKLEAQTNNQDMEIKTEPGDLAWSEDGVVVIARSAITGPETYSAPAEDLVAGFYNLYEVPVREGAAG